MTRRTALTLVVALAACVPSSEDVPGESAAPAFRHDLGGGAVPWTHDRFDAPDSDFTFAIVGDLTGGERDRVFDVAVAQLSILRPELILTVGDLIEGASEDPDALGAEWDAFQTRARAQPAPLFHVSGNHDATAQALRDVWTERHGALHYHFVYKDVLFLVLDSDDHTPERRERIRAARNEAVATLYAGDVDGYLASEYYAMPERQTGRIGPEQAAYFQRVLARNPDVRWTLLFMHKPVWRAEDGSGGFAALERALARRPYSVFAGHFHAFGHEIRNGRDYTQLGTTGGSQSASNDRAFDHMTLVRMTAEGPSVAHLRLDGILDRTGHIPAGGDSLCFQASRCGGGAPLTTPRPAPPPGSPSG